MTEPKDVFADSGKLVNAKVQMNGAPMIPTALTADEWASRPQDGLPGTWRDPATALRMLALANAALPDGDPRKITREDVALLGEAAGALLDVARDGEDAAKATAADRLAAKLAALLPPE